MHKRWTFIAGATLTSILLAAPGCGGSGDSDSQDSNSALTKAEFIKQADAICTKAGKQTEAEFEEFTKDMPQGKRLTGTQYAEVGEAILVPALNQQVERIGALEAPADDEALIGEFLGEVKVAAEKAERNPQTAAESPTKLLAEADKLITDYGFEVCGNR